MRVRGAPSRRLSLGRGSGTGFTLVEILLVVLLLGVVAGLSIPNFSRAYQTLRVRSVAGRMESLMRYAQARAVMSRLPVRLVFDPAGERFWLEQWTRARDDSDDQEGFQPVPGRWGQVFSIPESIRLVDPPGEPLLFLADGQISAGEVGVCSGKETGDDGCLVLSTRWQYGQVTILIKGAYAS